MDKAEITAALLDARRRKRGAKVEFFIAGYGWITREHYIAAIKAAKEL